MSKSTLRTGVAVALITSVVLTYQACGQATSFSTPETAEKEGYGGSNSLPSIGGTTTDNPKATVNLVAMSYTSNEVTSIDLCVEKLRFKSPKGITTASVKKTKSHPQGKQFVEALLAAIFGGHHQGGKHSGHRSSSYSSSSSETSIYMTPAQPEHTFARGGSAMEKFEIPVNTYTGVEIELNKDCAKGAITINKQDGTTETSNDSDLKLHFEGKVVIKNSGDLKLDLQKIVDQLNDADSDDDIEDALDNAKGAIQ